jgi:hypothetical protein
MVESDEGMRGQGEMPLKMVTLMAKDGRLDDSLDPRILLPSDLLRSMLPEDCECATCLVWRDVEDIPL